MSEHIPVGVVGTGTMGAGIAQLAAQAGHPVLLFDARSGAAAGTLEKLVATLNKLEEKGRLKPGEAAAVAGRITAANDLKDFSRCHLVLEAIVEDLGAKKQLFTALEAVVTPRCALATNTSSLSVTAIAAACRLPERFIGLHFFNPAPLLPLVEVVPGMLTDGELTAALVERMKTWGKVPVLCKDTPGFIVNRVARPFYGESIRLFEEGMADMATIDTALKTIGGFRMGPFELMDLIGNDINYTVTRTVWEAFHFDPRYKPSFTQQRQVESGRLGRKSGQGYYSYVGDAAQPAITVPEALGRQVVERVLAMLINEAADALFWRIATAGDIDLAMTKGVNYPKGLLAWADEQGAVHWLSILENLQAEYGEDRYRPSPLLRRLASMKGRFH